MQLTTAQVSRLQTQTTQHLKQAEQRLAAAIKALETYYDQHSNYSGTVEQQALEREYKASQRLLRSARTLFCRLARQYCWDAPAAGGPAGTGE